MNTNTASLIFECLSSNIRLDIYRLLVKKGTEGMVAGDIAANLGLPASNVSFHLKTLTQATLLTVEQEGRFLRYKANLALMLDAIAYLTEECCADNPQYCADLRSASRCCPEVLPPLASLKETS